MPALKNLFSLSFLFTLFLLPNFAVGQTASYGATAPDTIVARRLLEEVKALMQEKRWEQAMAKLDSAKVIYVKVVGEESQEVANIYHQEGVKEFIQNNYDLAITIWEKALQIRIKVFGEKHLDVAKLYYNLGLSHQNKQNYDRAITYFENSLSIRLQLLKENNIDIANNYFQLGRAYLEKNDFSKAFSNVQIALNIQEDILGSENFDVGTSYGTLGNIYQQKGDYENAISNYEKTLHIFIKNFGEKSKEVADVYNSLGGAYIDNNDYQNAIYYYEKGMQIRIDIFGEKDIKTVMSYANLGNVYNYMGSYEKAIFFSNKALEGVFHSFGEGHPSIVGIYGNLGNSYADLGNYEIAFNYYKKSLNLQLLNSGEDNLDATYSYLRIGILYNKIGDYIKSIQYLEKALGIQKRIFLEDNPTLHYAYNNIGISYYYRGEYRKSIEYFEEALRLLTLNTSELSIGAAWCYHNIGGSYSDLNEYERASNYLNKALEIRLKLQGNKHPDVATSYINLGTLYQKKKDYDEAISYFNRAADIFSTVMSKHHPSVALSYSNIGVCYDHKNQFDKAISVYYEGIKSNTDSSGVILSMPIQAKLFQQIGQSYIHWYREKETEEYLSQSNQALQNAKNIIQNQYSTFSQSESKEDLLEISHSIYEDILLNNQLIRVKQNLESFSSESFNISELSRHMILLESTKESQALQFSSIPDNILQKEKNLRVDIAYYDKKRQEKLSEGLSQTDTTVLVISSKLFDLNREYEALKARFERDYPDYYRLKYDLSTVSVEEVQNQLLEKGQTMLEYFVGDSSIFVFVIRPDKYEVKEIPRDFALDSLVQQLRDGLYGYHSASRKTDKLFEETINKYTATAQQLYQKLVAPVEHLLTDNLLIIPDGILGYVSFEALLTGAIENEKNYASYPYLLKKYRVSYCYSATLLQEMKQKQHRRQPSKTLLAMAPFYNKSYDYLENQFGKILQDELQKDSLDFFVNRKSFRDLPNSGEEAITASKLWKGDYFVNKDATEERFNHLAGDYRILHLPTHGVADHRVGDYSYLAFTEVQDSVENELLYVRDLYNLQLNADLVILSACETGVGELQRGEGIISLARAFAYAGAKSMVTSLWVANDTSTKELMTEFHKQLRKGKTKDVALQAAKLEYLDKRPGNEAHPYFWAAFIAIGDMSKIK